MEAGLIGEVAQYGLATIISVVLLLWKRADDANYQKIISGYADERQETVVTLLEVLTRNANTLATMEGTLRDYKEALQLSERLRQFGETRRT